MDSVENLLEIMRRLREPGKGCPWDLAQTFETIVPHTLEEAYEVAATIEHGDMAELRDELGDLLFQVVFYAQLAAEQDHFDFRDVAGAICDKLVRRHPHVFAGESVGSVQEQTRAWEAHKAGERAQRAGARGERPPSLLDGVLEALPALSRAQKLQRRAARAGFDWDSAAGVVEKLREEIDELQAALDKGRQDEAAGELGDLLFTCANLARHLDTDAEQLARRAARKFERRFRALEQHLAPGGGIAQSDAAQMDAAWEAVKAGEPDPTA